MTESNDVLVVDESPVEAAEVQPDPAPSAPPVEVVPVDEVEDSLTGFQQELISAIQQNAAEGNASLTASVQAISDRPFMTTEFSEYTVTEGLLLVISVFLVLNFFLSLIRRWF